MSKMLTNFTFNLPLHYFVFVLHVINIRLIHEAYISLAHLDKVSFYQEQSNLRCLAQRDMDMFTPFI